MIVIPELQTIMLLVPRTGSGSLKRAILARYPKAVMLYRHMEADGVPDGYDRWQKVGIVRHPVDRLWSLYKFLDHGKVLTDGHPPAYVARQHASVQRPFEDWLINNQVVFTNPYDTEGRLLFDPLYAVRHSLPETRKSQFLYLRPDLGTRIVEYADLHQFARELDLEPVVTNTTRPGTPPPLSSSAADHVRRVFSWEIERGYEIEEAA